MEMIVINPGLKYYQSHTSTTWKYNNCKTGLSVPIISQNQIGKTFVS